MMEFEHNLPIATTNSALKQHSHSLPELMMPSTKTPAFLSVQSCEKLSALEKEVEIPRATNKYLPVSFNFDYRKHLYVV